LLLARAHGQWAVKLFFSPGLVLGSEKKRRLGEKKSCSPFLRTFYRLILFFFFLKKDKVAVDPAVGFYSSV